MKFKKLITSLLGIGMISMLGVGTVFAASDSDTWTSPCHTYSGFINTMRGYGAEASTRIDIITKGHPNQYARAYVYIEGVDKNGYRVQYSNKESYGKPRAYIRTRAYNASYFTSRHTVKDPKCKNKYLSLKAIP